MVTATTPQHLLYGPGLFGILYAREARTLHKDRGFKVLNDDVKIDISQMGPYRVRNTIYFSRSREDD